jgi:predicted transcriptional regulator
MARTPQDVTEAELAVLEVLWDQGPAPIRRITEVLYKAAKPSQYATVQKLLERLEEKKFVTRDRAGPVHQFAAAVNRAELIGRRLQSVAEQLCGGSWTPLLTHLVQQRRLTAEERQALRDLIAETDPRPKKPPR